MKRILVITLALLFVMGAAAYAAPQLWNLGYGAGTTGLASDGTNIAVAGQVGGNAFVWSKANGAVNVNAGTSAGIAYGTYAGVSGLKVPRFDMAINQSGVAKRYEGNIAGVGAVSALPLSGTLNWVPLCTSLGSANALVGGYQSVSPTAESCRYKESSNSTSSLGHTGLNVNAYVYGISDSGQYAGQAQFGGSGTGGSRQAMGGSSLFMFNNLCGAPTTSNEASAYAIARDSSRIAGWSKDLAGNRAACYWNGPFAAGAVPVALPQLSGHNYAQSRSITGNGSMIAGFSLTLGNNATYKGWVWDAVNGTQDLGAKLTAAGIDMTGWLIKDVLGVSDDGKWFCGSGIYSPMGTGNSAWVAFIPEPSSILALFTGVIGLVAIRRRR